MTSSIHPHLPASFHPFVHSFVYQLSIIPTTCQCHWIRSVLFLENLTVYRERQIHEPYNVTSTSVGIQNGMEGGYKGAGPSRISRSWPGGQGNQRTFHIEKTAGEKSESLGISGSNPESILGRTLFYCWLETVTKIKFPSFSSHGSCMGQPKVKMVILGERKGIGNNAMEVGMSTSSSGNSE